MFFFCTKIIHFFSKAFLFIAQGIIHFYRLTFSIVFLDKCRYIPTCSVYALEALKKYGLWKGSRLTIRRILRCHPYSKHPFHDPLP